MVSLLLRLAGIVGVVVGLEPLHGFFRMGRGDIGLPCFASSYGFSQVPAGFLQFKTGEILLGHDGILLRLLRMLDEPSGVALLAGRYRLLGMLERLRLMRRLPEPRRFLCISTDAKYG